MRMARLIGLLLTVSCFAALAAQPKIATVSGSGQSVQVNADFTNQLVVLVTDSGGGPPSPAVAVTFTAPSSGPSGNFSGSLTTTVMTDPSGQAASPTFTAGATAGTYTITATAPGFAGPANFSLTNTPGPPFAITVVSGGGQSAPINANFMNPLVVLVNDSGGNVVPNAMVTFTVPNSGASGTFAGGVNTATTGMNGQATSAVITANGTAGSYGVTAASGAATGATFSLTNTAPLAPVLSVTKMHGSFTQGQNGTWTLNVSNTGTGSTSGTVTVTDTLPTGYTLVSGTGTGWSCSGTNAVSCTNSTVVAASGSFAPLILTVSVPANSPVSVQNSATASGGGAASPATSNTDTVPVMQVAATIAATTGSGQSAQTNTAFASPLVATVRDAGGVVMQNATVTFTVVPNAGASGTFAGGQNTATTGANGQATSVVFTANGTAGSYSVTAASGAATGATFSLTNTAPTAPTLSITKNHGAFTQGQNGAWTLNVSNTGTGSTSGTVTVTDTLPTGYTLVSGTGTGWSCSGTNAVSCTNSTVVAASGTFAPLILTVSVPANSLTSVQNLATASGGGAASSATSNTDTVPVTQVPASITITGGNGQSAPVGTAFANALVVTVKDAANTAVPNVPVTFTAPASGASGKFANNTATTTVNTDTNGVATATTFTANSTVGGPYNVVASTAGATSMNFSLTNTFGGATKLTFTTQPPANGTAAGMPFTTVVQVQDSGGNLVTTSTASITITSMASGVTGTTRVVASGGVATFNNLILNTAGSYTLTAAAASLTPDVSNSITIAPGTASQLVFTTQPSNGTAGQALTPAVVVKIQDNFGNVVNSTASVVVSSAPTGVNTQVNASAGVATFNNLSFNTANSYTLTATSGALTVQSSSFTISAASANKLVFSTQPPANGTAGQAFSAVVKVQDSNGNLVTSSNASITIGSSPSGITGTVTATASGGVATFNSLVLNTAGSYTLGASASGLNNATSNPIAIVAASASQLVFTTQPSSGTAGQALTPAVVLQIQDAFGNVVGSNAQVTIASVPAGAGGTTQINAVAGVATFNNLVFNAANNYTLTATSASIPSSTSNQFTISAASANKLVFTTQPPANGTAGQAFSAVVKVQDANGNVTVSSVTQVTITSPASITGTTQVTAVNGVATFNNLILDTAGSYTLTATSTGLTNASSNPIAIGAAAASQLVFATQPSSGTAGQALTPAVVAKIQDAFGNLVSSNAAVAVASNPTGVGGTTQVNAIAGVATFNGLQFSIANNYTLTATSGSLASAVSNQFTISAASANKLVFTTQPPANGTAGQAFSAVVKVQDANGNVVTGSSAQITITSPASITGTTQVTAINGVATFNNLVLNTAGTYTLAATSSGLTNASSTQIAIGAAPASQVVFTTQPSSGTAGQALTPSVVAQIQDAFGNLVGSNAAVAIASNPTGVTGTTQVNATAGVATFNGLQFSIANNYTLTATSGSLASAVSNQFTISAASANKLVFTTQPPANGTSTQAFGAVVKVEDANGNVVTGSSAQIRLQLTPDSVSTVTAVNGVATFNNLFTNFAGSYTLTATSTGLTNAISTPILIGPTTASQVVFTTQPNSGTAGQPLTPAVVATIQDVFSNTVNSSALVTITSTPSGVNGTTQMTAVNGAATFNNLTFNVAGNYTLTVASAGLTGMDSSPFTISAGSGNKLVFTSQPPANGTAGQALSSTVAVQVQDANGNLVTGSNATVNISSTPVGVTGTLSVPAVSGVATFNSLVFSKVGTYTLTATSTGLSNATSTSITIGPGAPSTLAFTVQPSSSTAGQPLTPAVVVQIQDAFQNLVSGSSAPVTVSSTPSGLGGTLTVNAVGGVATFGDLTITTAGNYTMAATSPGLTSTNSGPSQFTISPGNGNRLVFATQPPSSATAGQP